jgi:hypothetical protein
MATGTVTHAFKINGDKQKAAMRRANKIAIQFNDAEFAELNNYAKRYGISFAAAVRERIFHPRP